MFYSAGQKREDSEGVIAFLQEGRVGGLARRLSEVRGDVCVGWRLEADLTGLAEL